MIASIALAASMTSVTVNKLGGDQSLLQLLPLILASLGLICSLIGILMVKIFSNKSPEIALRFGTIGSAIFFIIFISANQLFKCVSWCMGCSSNRFNWRYYCWTRYGILYRWSPVRKIAKGGETGSATIMITGLATGMQSVAIPVFTIVCIIFSANYFAGLYGVGIAAIGMLSTVGITMAIDAMVLADNAGGIAEMAKMGKKQEKLLIH